ncbi:MAG: ribosome-associated translation inhibitor RaiA [Armatimonadetes bacterium]|nr:ribosome-associated translation inhibitor RaiA [Armatimonadota bacterium]
MRIEFTGRNSSLSPAFEEHAEKRLARLTRLADRVGVVRVVVSEQRGRKDVEITADLDGTLIRSEVKGPDERVGFDSALDKLERQVKKFRARFQRRRRSQRHAAQEEAEAAVVEVEKDAQAEPAAGDEPQVVRTKTVTLKPMSPEEAALQMELIGHDFFLFRNAESDLVSVVYRRTDGDYGLIECES